MASTWPFIISTAKRSSSRRPAWLPRALFAAALLLASVPGLARACPFCTAIAPTLCQLRQQAAVTALVEVNARGVGDKTAVRIHRALDGGPRLGGKTALELPLDVMARPGDLLVVFGTGANDAPLGELTWHAVPVNETSYAYFVRAPALKTPTAERLRYFGPFLEHRDALIAQDAYLEFGHAPFDQVAGVAEVLPLTRMRSWLTDAKVPQDRKGLYGLALGLGGDAATRAANAEFLKGLVLEPEDDFRGGFDGILGGYLLLAGTSGLELIESRYLANPRAADGDVRHAMTALRFYHEFGHDIPPARLAAAMARLIERPEFAEAAITDLARWKDWTPLASIARRYTDKAYAQPAVRRAIVGYLLSCPLPEAVPLLAHCRDVDPQGVAEAEQTLSRTTTLRPAD